MSSEFEEGLDRLVLCTRQLWRGATHAHMRKHAWQICMILHRYQFDRTRVGHVLECPTDRTFCTTDMLLQLTNAWYEAGLGLRLKSGEEGGELTLFIPERRKD